MSAQLLNKFVGFSASLMWSIYFFEFLLSILNSFSCCPSELLMIMIIRVLFGILRSKGGYPIGNDVSFSEISFMFVRVTLFNLIFELVRNSFGILFKYLCWVMIALAIGRMVLRKRSLLIVEWLKFNFETFLFLLKEFDSLFNFLDLFVKFFPAAELKRLVPLLAENVWLSFKS